MINRLTSIQSKILFILLTTSLLSALLVGGEAFYSMGEIKQSAIDIMTEKNRGMLKLMVQEQSKNLREILKRTEQSINVLADNFVWKKGEKAGDINHILESMKNNNPYIYNVYIATANAKFAISSKYPNGERSKNYNPLIRPWYLNAIKSKALVWSKVYRDAGKAGKLIITCSKVIYNAQGKVAAVVGIDLSVEEMNKIINIQNGKLGYTFLIDGTGHLIARPKVRKTDPRWDGILAVPVGGDLSQIKDSGFQTILEEMINNEKGFVEWQQGTDSEYIAFATATTTNWTLGLVVSKKDVEREVKSSFIEQIKKVGINFTIILVGIILLVIMIGIKGSKRIIRPIKALNDGVQKVGAGNLDYNIEVKTGDELEQLANEFNKMSTNLQHYIDDLKTTTKQKERIESELNIASRIQHDMLPMIFPPFPKNKEVDIFASMSAAKQVGGDFYDFFLINPNKLCFVIADVSGKGVPASLFMVISKTLIKNEAMSSISPAEVLYKVNNILNEGNDEMMFVTVLLCVMDLTTGEVEFANGGHNPPLLMKKEQRVEFVELNKSKILGVFPGNNYSNQKLTLDLGETLFLYTDGVTEAMDPTNNQFSESRLHKTISGLQERSVKRIEDGVQKAIKDFVIDAEQSDDITILVVRYNGGRFQVPSAT